MTGREIDNAEEHDDLTASTIPAWHRPAGRSRMLMKALRLALLALLRDGKSGELRVLMLALLVAVSALTAVGFFTSRVSLAVDQQAGEVLAADLRLQSRTALDREYFELAAQARLRTAELSTFPSVVFHGEDSALTAIRAEPFGRHRGLSDRSKKNLSKSWRI